MATYQVWNQWGGLKAPWHKDGVWMMGGRHNQFLSYVKMQAPDNGFIMNGELAYEGEQKINCRAEEVGWNKWAVQVEINGSWQLDGVWVMGDRYPQRITQIDVTAEGDHTLLGTTTYTHEGPIGFKGVLYQNL